MSFISASPISISAAQLRFADYIVWIDLAVLVVEILGAFYIKASDPEKYDKIGRLIYEGVPERP